MSENGGPMPRFLSVAIALVLAGASRAAESPPTASDLPQGPGLAARYPADLGIAKDAAVFFADDFESGDLKKWDDRSGTITVVQDKPHAGKHCASAEMHRGRDHG